MLISFQFFVFALVYTENDVGPVLTISAKFQNTTCLTHKKKSQSKPTIYNMNCLQFQLRRCKLYPVHCTTDVRKGSNIPQTVNSYTDFTCVCSLDTPQKTFFLLSLSQQHVKFPLNSSY